MKKIKATPTLAKVKVETVLVLRTCAADGSSSYGFKWPESGPVEATDWKPTEECGNGLHGWLWGHGDWSLKAKAEKIKWLVLEVDKSSLIDLCGKVKFPKANVFSSFLAWNDAMVFIPRTPRDRGHHDSHRLLRSRIGHRQVPVTHRPQAATVTRRPQASPVTRRPQAAPVTHRPQATPVTHRPQATTVTHRPQATPVTHRPQATTVTHRPQATPVTHRPQATPVTHRPQATPVTHRPQATTVTHRPQATPVTHRPQATPVGPLVVITLA